MITLQNAPLPSADPIATKDGSLSGPWAYFLNTMLQVLNACFQRLNQTSLTDQAASIGATDLTDGTFGAGFYRLDYYARITRAATTSSSLEVTFAWTDAAVSLSATGTAMVTNATSEYQSGSIVVYSNGASPITYATTYATSGATAMRYRLGVFISRVYA